MNRYECVYEIHEDALFVGLRETLWGKIARRLHLPDRNVAKFVEKFEDVGYITEDE